MRMAESRAATGVRRIRPSQGLQRPSHRSAVPRVPPLTAWTTPCAACTVCAATGEAPPKESASWSAKRIEPPPPSGEEPRLFDIEQSWLERSSSSSLKRRRGGEAMGEAPLAAGSAPPAWPEYEGAEEEEGRERSSGVPAPLRWCGPGGGDERLAHLVPRLLRANPTNWATISTHLPGRSGRECRERWSEIRRE